MSDELDQLREQRDAANKQIDRLYQQIDNIIGDKREHERLVLAANAPQDEKLMEKMGYL